MPNIADLLGFGLGGIRHSGQGVKGGGYFGRLLNKQGGYSTELSSEFEHQGNVIEHPLMVPTLAKEELELLLSGAEPTDAIYRKAQDYALQRIQQGKSPFADSFGIKYPVPR